MAGTQNTFGSVRLAADRGQAIYCLADSAVEPTGRSDSNSDTSTIKRRVACGPCLRVLPLLLLLSAPGCVLSQSHSPSTEEIAGAMEPQLAAFPGALGAGRHAIGGRGGAIVIVDTNDDEIDPSDGRTSLREALQEHTGPRTIVFRVGGVFDTSSAMLIMDGEADSRVTVACQSAPQPGVKIVGRGLRMTNGVHDVVMRHCTFRNTDPGENSPDVSASRGIGIVGTTKPVSDLLFDHLSISWATDENWTVWTGENSTGSSGNITLSNSIIAEGDADSSHPESGQLPRRYIHSMGPSCNSAALFRIEGCSIIANFIAHNARRNPLMWGVKGEVVGNIVYNWHEAATQIAARHAGADVYVAHNVFRAGPTTKRNALPIDIYSDARRNTAEWRLVARENTYEPDAVSRIKLRDQGDVSGIDPFPGGIPVADLDCVGASVPERDDIDRRIVGEYLDYSGSVGIGAHHHRDISSYASTSRWDEEYDSDADGMADAWERDQGLDPTSREDSNQDQDGDGYTNLEEFLNVLAECVHEDAVSDSR